LTSERVRIEIRKLLLEKGYDAPSTIVAGGDQGADPHSRGTGPLRAHETIIIDIFPRSSTTWYWGDMSRTFVKGRASAAVRKLHRDVLDAQELVFPRLRPGAEGQKIHEEVVAFFKERGNAFARCGEGRQASFMAPATGSAWRCTSLPASRGFPQRSRRATW